MAQGQENPGSRANEIVFLVAGSAADLIDKLAPKASTPTEKLAVAAALVAAFDLPRAKRPATAAGQQSTNVREQIYAGTIVANINFQINDVAGGRDEYRQIISLLQVPQGELDSSIIRELHAVRIELQWAADEYSFAKSCQDAAQHLRSAERALDRLPQDRVVADRVALDNVVKVVTAGCPSIRVS